MFGLLFIALYSLLARRLDLISLKLIAIEDVLRVGIRLPHWFPITHADYTTSWFLYFLFILQNSKPDSLLKMEEEHKFEKSTLGHKDNKFSFSLSNKKLLGWVEKQTDETF